MPSLTASMGEWALWYAAMGWPVFPCRGKRPMMKQWQRVASADPERIRQWWTDAPMANIGCAMGAIWALDCDARHEGPDTLRALEQRYAPLPRTVTSLTGSGGGSCHYLWQGTAKNKAKLGSGLDVQGPGSYIILPPSIHPDTHEPYCWEADFGPDDLDVQEPPEWLAALVNPPTASSQPLHDPDSPILHGQREATLMRMAGAMRRHGATYDTVRAALAIENEKCVPPLDNAALDRMAQSVQKYAPVIDDQGQAPPGWAGEQALPPDLYSTAWRRGLFYKSKKERDLTQNAYNLTVILENHGYWQEPEHQLWWDSVRGTPMCGESEITDKRMMEIAAWFGGVERLPITSLAMLEKCVVARCKASPRDLLQIWLNGLEPWDGKPRLLTWLHDIAGLSRDTYCDEVSRMLIVSMVARALVPGCHYRYVVVFEGAQEFGKSALVLNLASQDWYVPLMMGFETKEAHMMLQGAWIAELVELDSVSRTDEARLKAFITMREDSFIPKYSNFRQRLERRAIFIGTTNDSQWMKDQTGGTRYLPLALPDPIDHEQFLQMRTQLFAEALVYYYSHVADFWLLSPEAQTIAQVEREQRRISQVYEGPLEEWLEETRWKHPYHDLEGGLVTFTKDETSWQEIALCYLKAEPERWKDKNLQIQIIASLKALGWYSTTARKGTRTIKVWRKRPVVPF
jgi:hypothetical protein